MSKINRFEDLEVWRQSMDLAAEVYDALKSCRDFGLRDQMQRAAVSIPSNISACSRSNISDTCGFKPSLAGVPGEIIL